MSEQLTSHCKRPMMGSLWACCIVCRHCPVAMSPHLDGAQPVRAQQELAERQQHLHRPAVPALGSRDGHLCPTPPSA